MGAIKKTRLDKFREKLYQYISNNQQHEFKYIDIQRITEMSLNTVKKYLEILEVREEIESVANGRKLYIKVNNPHAVLKNSVNNTTEILFDHQREIEEFQKQITYLRIMVDSQEKTIKLLEKQYEDLRTNTKQQIEEYRSDLNAKYENLDKKVTCLAHAMIDDDN